MIRLINVWYFYESTPAVKGLNLTLNDDVVYIIGPNASGKTTIMKLLSLIYPPTKGKVLYNEENPWQDEKLLLKLRKRVVYVHEKPILLRGTVIDNVVLPLVLRGIPRSEAIERAKDLLRELGLESVENKKRRDLSAGQAQLVSLCRALVLDDVEYIFLDSPTSMLDIENRKRVIAAICKKSARKVIATLDLALPLQLPGRVLLLDSGELREDITPEEYKAKFLTSLT